MIPRVSFGACYVYSPNGLGNASGQSRLLRNLLKAGDSRFISHHAGLVRRQVSDRSAIAGFLRPGDVLVPVPGSVAAVDSTTRSGAIADRLAIALLAEGLGCKVWRGLTRVRSVRRSSTAAPGSRPSVGRHFESFAVDQSAAPELRAAAAPLVLIDDVVTKGRTLLAAASRLCETFPSAEIRAFALVRTMGLSGGVECLLQPCVGEISWWRGDAHRTP